MQDLTADKTRPTWIWNECGETLSERTRRQKEGEKTTNGKDEDAPRPLAAAAAADASRGHHRQR